MAKIYEKTIEEKMLKEWMGSKAPVAIYLKNGISLKGVIVDYCNESISLSNGDEHAISKIFKQAITTIFPFGHHPPDKNE